MNVDDVLGFGAARIVIATGSKWRPASLQRDGTCRAVTVNEVLTPDDIMDGQTPQGRILVHDTEGGYMGGLIAERLQRSGAAVVFSTPALTHSAFLALTLEQDRVLRRLTSLGVMMISSRELSGLSNGQATLGSTLGADPLTLEIDQTVLVADRIPIDGLAKQLQSDSERLRDAGILSVDLVGDCVAPGLIAHAVYAGHRLALSF